MQSCSSFHIAFDIFAAMSVLPSHWFVKMQDTGICYLFVGLGLKIVSLAENIKISKVYKASPKPVVGFNLIVCY